MTPSALDQSFRAPGEPHPGLAPAPPPPLPPVPTNNTTDPDATRLASALDQACPISGNDFLALHRLLIAAFAEAPDRLPWAARLTFEPPILRAPPEHPHRFPDHRAWRPVSMDWLNFLNYRASRPACGPASEDICTLRLAFLALFPTNSADDLPPSQNNMRTLLRLPAAQSCLASVAHRPAPPPARRFFVTGSGVEVSRAGIYDLLRLTRRLLDLLPLSATLLSDGATDLLFDSTSAATEDFLAGFPRDPCPARPVARATLQYLNSQLDAIRPTGPLPTDTDVPRDFSYHHRTLDAIDTCHQWLWPVLGRTPTRMPILDRACISGVTPWQPWLSQWDSLRDLLR